MQQLLRALAVALIDLTQPAAAALALCVDRLDELHQIPAVMALQHLLIVLARQTHAVAREMVDLDIRNITHKRLSLLPRDDRAHENRRVHRNIDGLPLFILRSLTFHNFNLDTAIWCKQGFNTICQIKGKSRTGQSRIYIGLGDGWLQGVKG